MKWIFLLAFFLKCNGFLLESSSNPTPSVDDKYDHLLTLLNAERRSRKAFEAEISYEVQKLKEELSRCHCHQHKPVDTTSASGNITEKLRTELLELQNNYNALKGKLGDLEQNNANITNKINQMESELFVFQNTTNMTNSTDLAEVLRKTDNKINSIAKKVNETEKDFIALLHKVSETEDRMENATTLFKAELNGTASQLRQDIENSGKQTDQKFSSKISAVATRQIDIVSKQKDIEAEQSNITLKQNEIAIKLQENSAKLQQSIDRVNNRVILRTCGGGTKNNIIQFNSIETVNGIKNTDSIRNSGVFIVERSGFYLISIYIRSNNYGGMYRVTKNGYIVIQADVPRDYVTSSSTAVTHLAVNDTMAVEGSLVVFGSLVSCINFVQL